MPRRPQAPSPFFKGVWIPKDIWESEHLTLQEKAFYVQIDSLSDETSPCWAGNSHFSRFFGLSESRCSAVIASLVSKGLVTSKVKRSPLGSKRHLRISPLPGNAKCALPENAYKNSKAKSNSKRTKDIPPRRSDDEGPVISDKPISTKYEQRHYNLSARILQIQNENHPKLCRDVSEKKIIAGAETLSKLERIDKYDLKIDVKPVLLWATEDDFWSRNFLSCAPLRDTKGGSSKFVKIYAAYEQRGGGKTDAPKELDRMYDRSFTKPFEDFIGEGSVARSQALFDNLEKIEDYHKGSRELNSKADTAQANYHWGSWKVFAGRYLRYLQEECAFATCSPAMFDIDNSTFWTQFIAMADKMFLCKLDIRK